MGIEQQNEFVPCVDDDLEEEEAKEEDYLYPKLTHI